MLYPSPTTPSTDPVSEKTLDILKQKVFEKRPTLRQLFEKFGDTTVSEFVPIQFQFPANAAIAQERKQELITAIAKNVEKKLGQEVGESVKRQLNDHYFVSTAFHHGPITYPGYMASNMLTTLYRQSLHSSTFENIILLSCANVSFDNFSFPRGLMLHDIVNGQEFSNQLVFFPRKVRPYPVVYHPAFTKESLIEAYGRIEAWANKEFAIQKTNAEKLKALVQDLIDTDFVLSEKTFSDQTTKINFLLWKKLFPHGIHMIDLEQEEIVTELLLSFHMQQETLIHRLLFSPKYTEQILKQFDGIHSAFTTASNSGTFLFWAFPNNQRTRMQLWKKGNKLVTADETYTLELTPSAISDALRKQEIIPSTLLSFMMLSFYYGLDLIGGMSQTSYLPKMQEAFIKLLAEVGEPEHIPLIQGLESTHQNFVRCDMAFLDNPLGTKTLATTIDMLLYGNEDFVQTFQQISENITVSQMLSRALPELYRQVLSQDQQEEYLLAVTKDDIDTITGYNKKITPVGTIK